MWSNRRSLFAIGHPQNVDLAMRKESDRAQRVCAFELQPPVRLAVDEDDEAPFGSDRRDQIPVLEVASAPELHHVSAAAARQDQRVGGHPHPEGLQPADALLK